MGLEIISTIVGLKDLSQSLHLYDHHSFLKREPISYWLTSKAGVLIEVWLTEVISILGCVLLLQKQTVPPRVVK